MDFLNCKKILFLINFFAVIVVVVVVVVGIFIFEPLKCQLIINIPGLIITLTIVKFCYLHF